MHQLYCICEANKCRCSNQEARWSAVKKIKGWLVITQGRTAKRVKAGLSVKDFRRKLPDEVVKEVNFGVVTRKSKFTAKHVSNVIMFFYLKFGVKSQ